MKRARTRKGMTLIELTIVITIIAIITTVYFMVGNPGGQLASARNSERLNHLQAIMNGIQMNIADYANRQFSCVSGPVPTSTKRMASSGGTSTYNIAPCLVPTYLSVLPFDPSASSSHFVSISNYDTGYTISLNASGTLIVLSAPFAEASKTISVSGW